MIPVVVTYNLAAANVTAVVNALGTVAAGTLTLTATTVVLDTQRRLLFTAAGNGSANTFVVKGTNAAGIAVNETVIGPNATTTQTNVDFKTVTSITALTTTAGTLSVGTDGVGSTLWNILNWDVTPASTALAGIVMSSGTAVNWSIEYTYDDPNNLSPNVNYAAPFLHPILQNQTTNADSALSTPVTAWRLKINSGTGTMRAIGTQAGIAGP